MKAGDSSQFGSISHDNVQLYYDLQPLRASPVQDDKHGTSTFDFYVSWYNCASSRDMLPKEESAMAPSFCFQFCSFSTYWMSLFIFYLTIALSLVLTSWQVLLCSMEFCILCKLHNCKIVSSKSNCPIMYISLACNRYHENV